MGLTFELVWVSHDDGPHLCELCPMDGMGEGRILLVGQESVH